MAPSLHLSDPEIDAYWKGRLAAADEERVELHYLECAECRERAGAVEALIDTLRLDQVPAAPPARPLRAWQLAAVVFAVAAVGAAWQWARLARDARLTEAPPAALVQTDGSALAVLSVAVEPPTRSASAAELTMPPGVSIVVFDLDTREAGAPHAMLDVSLTGPDGRSIMRVQARSSAEGRIAVPVHRSLLEPGQFQFDVTGGGAAMTLPLLIQQPTQHP